MAEQLRAKKLAEGFRMVGWVQERMGKRHSGPAVKMIDEIMSSASGASDAVEFVEAPQPDRPDEEVPQTN